MAMMLLTTVYRFWVGGYHVGGREQRGHISTILRINFLILFFTGLVDLTFPSWVIPFKVRIPKILYCCLKPFMVRVQGISLTMA